MKNLIEFISKPVIEFYIPQVIEFLPIEEYRPININNEFITYDYLISNYGNIYSNKTNKILSQYIDENRYHRISLQIKNKRLSFKVSRLVLMTFNPILTPELYQANHKNGNKSENGIWNLEWTTQIENIYHAYMTGLINNGLYKKHSSTYLNDIKVHEICNYLQDGYNYNQICEFMNIDKNEYRRFKDIIHSIVTKDAWKYISKNYNITKKKQTLYSEEIIHKICKCLEKESTYDEICEKFPEYNHNKLKNLIYNLISKNVYTYISDQYSLIRPKSKTDPIFTDEQVHYICKLLKMNISYSDIVTNLNIDYDSLDKKRKRHILQYISDIKNKRKYIHISNIYY